MLQNYAHYSKLHIDFLSLDMDVFTVFYPPLNKSEYHTFWADTPNNADDVLLILDDAEAIRPENFE